MYIKLHKRATLYKAGLGLETAKKIQETQQIDLSCKLLKNSGKY